MRRARRAWIVASLAMSAALTTGLRIARADASPDGGASHPEAGQATSAFASNDAGSGAPAPQEQPVLVAPADTDQRMDLGLEALTARRYPLAAAILYGVYEKLPLGDPRRDLSSFHLATALVELGFTQAAIEHYLEIITGRHTPELTEKALVALQPLYERRYVSEGRFVEGALYSGQFSNLSTNVGDFVEYLQALTDVRHGFTKWGRARLDVLAHTDRTYAFSARYALAVEKIAQKEDDAAATDLRAIIAATNDIPFEIRNKSRIALGRILYEKKLYDEAWQVYSQVDSPLPLQDLVMIERAWDRVASGDQTRALGLLVGLGAPVFHGIFSPERYLIRSLALRRICQYRAAHLTVRDFRANYAHQLEKIHGRAPLKDDPTIRQWAIAGTPSLRELGRIHDILVREQATLGSVGDAALSAHLKAVYGGAIASTGRAIDGELDDATEKVADELLRIDEQMSLVDYEIGAGLFRSGGEGQASRTGRSTKIAQGTGEVYFKFDGEYWSDELGDFAVLADDRCVR